jgi:hypothetical protein
MSTQPAPQQIPPEVSALETACENLIQHRQRPLLVLFYPVNSRIGEWDLEDVYKTLRSSGATPENRIPKLYVLLDSYGGGPVAGYRLAQLIRDFSEDVSFLVPDHAYSAATLLCFSGNEIRLAHYAGLSPIDITLVSESGKSPRKEVELATVDSFMEFAQNARKRIEEQLALIGCSGVTNIDSDLLVTMVKEVGAMQVGKYYRERLLTGHYAETLLDSYMFADCTDKVQRRQDVIRKFLFGAPAHNFHLDWHLCDDWRLKIEEMPTIESDLAKEVLNHLTALATAGIICENVTNRHRLPYFGWYAQAAQPAPPAQPAPSAQSAPSAQAAHAAGGGTL